MGRRLNTIFWWSAALILSISALDLVPWFITSWATDPYFSHGGLVMLWGIGLAFWRLSSSEQTLRP
ncbi:MAG: hypothetical protein Q9M30_01505, partial [Mariprofundaceae bacterium]|nr:hypothetical protein [Mariprofundaceae bacterium]